MTAINILRLIPLLLKSKEWYVIGFLPGDKHFIDANCQIDKFARCTETYINDQIEQDGLLKVAKEIINNQ